MMNATKGQQVLLVGASHPTYWQNALRQAIAMDHGLQAKTREELLEQLPVPYPDLYIIDAAYVEDVTGTVQAIREHDADGRVLVVGSARDAQAVRDVLVAGAADYVRRPLSRAALLKMVDRALSSPARKRLFGNAPISPTREMAHDCPTHGADCGQ